MRGYGPHFMYCIVSWPNGFCRSRARRSLHPSRGLSAGGGRPLAAQHGHTGNAGAASLLHTTNYGEILAINTEVHGRIAWAGCGRSPVAVSADGVPWAAAGRPGEPIQERENARKP